MQVHDLAPSPGSTKNRKRVGRGTGGKGGKTAGRGTKGQRARNTVARGFEGGQMPLKQRVPKLKGFNNPFRVEYRPSTSTRSATSSRSSAMPTSRSTSWWPTGSSARAPTSRCSIVARSRRRSTCTPTECRRRLKPRSSLPAVRSRSSSCPSRPKAALAARPSRATSSPTVDVRRAPRNATSSLFDPLTRPIHRTGKGAARVFSRLANIFKISDLRNKILFVVAMVGVYRLGVFIRVPGVDSIAIESAPRHRQPAGGPRVPEPVLGWRVRKLLDLRARDHAVHHGEHHHAGARCGHPEAGRTPAGGCGRSAQDHAVHALRHDRTRHAAGDGSRVHLRHRARHRIFRRRGATLRPFHCCPTACGPVAT